jgi:hypothetical protein
MERSPVTIAEYMKGKYNHFLNSPKFSKLVGSYYNKGIANLHGIHSDRKTALIAKYGKQDCIFSSEHKWYIWGFKLPSGIKMLVLSSAVGGTTYEFLGKEPTIEDLKEFKTFLEEMIESGKPELKKRGIKA